MHKKSFIICGIACIAGIFGAFIRWVQNTSAFEPETGLSIPHSFWNYGMAIFMVLCAAALIFLIRSLRGYKSLDSYPEAFSGGKLICTISSFASLILMGAGGLLTFIGAARQRLSVTGDMSSAVFDLIGGLFAIAGAVALFIALRGINNAKASARRAPFIIVVLFMCFRLINEYKTCASDPVIWHFAVRILAIAAVLLAFYYLAGFCFDSAKIWRTIYFSLLGVILNISTLADSVSAGYHLITVGLTLSLLTFSLLLLGNLTQNGDPPEK